MDLDDATHSEVTEPEVLDNDSAGDGAEEVEVQEPDGFAIRDAKIAQLEMDVAAKDQTILQLRAHNYDLLMQIGVEPAGSEEPAEEESEASSGGVDDLFADRG